MWETPEDAFQELDSKKFDFLAPTLGGYLKALIKAGFTRREAVRLVESFSKFLYDMSIEEFISDRRIEEERILIAEEDLQDDEEVDFEDDDE